MPENRSKPDGRKIRIAVARVKATSPNPKPDPILWLAGGPGGTALATANLIVHAGLNADRDIVFIDQRGTLHADPRLSCPEIDAFQRDAVGLAPTDPATGQKDIAATRACRDRLAAKGYDLTAYNTHENAADIADLRLALGIREWNVYGVSYGTDLAQQLLRDHPQGVRSLVLDSAVPNTVNVIEGFWSNAAEGFRALLDGCAAQPPCALAYPNLGADLTTVVKRLTEQPLTVDVNDPSTNESTKVVLDGFQLANLIVVASLVPGSIARVPAFVHAIALGNGTLAATALLRTVSPPDIVGYGLAYGVFCRESIAFTSSQRTQAVARQALPDFPAPVLALVPQSAHLFGDCAAWNVGKADAFVFKPAHSSAPVLILAGTFDAVTPPSWADVAARSLTNSRVLRFPGAGHDVIIWSPQCAPAIMVSFLDRPQGGYDTSCLNTVSVPAFQVGVAS
ncbi:MAG: alpha/beta hydrolase [Candidatus Dormibacteraeota bacterium]|nr:alpha/beta hydrolase [Candidatus Dormibacteraeota bacterium]